MTLEDQAPTLAVGVLGILSGALHAEMIVAFLCAILGSGIGMAFLPAPMPISDSKQAMLRFAGNALFILITAIITMFAMHWLRKWAPDAQYPVAFFASLVLIFFKEQIIKGLGRMIDRKIDGV